MTFIVMWAAICMVAYLLMDPFDRFVLWGLGKFVDYAGTHA